MWPLCCRQAVALLRELPDEGAAVAALRESQAAVATCDPEEAAWLVEQGWWGAARALVTASHREASTKQVQAIETAVRREVGHLKRKADDLLLALSPQDSNKIGVVRCAFQWAQNSTAVFLSVKFAHRWSSPGALKVHNETLSVSPCCFNFSAEGEHSQLRKRYSLDLQLYSEAEPAHWNWQLASAGRFTAEIQKKAPAVWPQLSHGKDKSGSMVWESMQQRYKQELKAFGEAEEAARRKARKKGKPDEEPDEDEKLNSEHARHNELSKECTVYPGSPWRADRNMLHLCEKFWPPKMPGVLGKEATWLIMFFSSRELKCEERDAKCLKVRYQWTTVKEKLPDMTKAKVAVVDCDYSKDFCEKQEVGHFPFVRRYRKGKIKTYRDEWDIPSLSEFVTEA